MYNRLLLVTVLLGASIACNKDKFETKPSFEIKNINTTEIGPGQTLIVTMKYTDAEGDLAGGQISVQKIVPQCPLSNFTDTNKYMIPNDVPVTKNQQGEIDIRFPYININPFCNFNDTATFRFWVRDQNGHTSDTVTTGTIVIRRT